jgi:hypothetical protein
MDFHLGSWDFQNIDFQIHLGKADFHLEDLEVQLEKMKLLHR